MALQKQIWISQIMKNYYSEALFLKFAQDMSENVNFDIINMADCGFDPDVLVNNTTYPIAIVEREDTPLSFELDLFETTNTKVSNPEAMEYAYNKMESVIYSHRMSLIAKTGAKAAHAYSPTSNTENTPIIETTGPDNGEGFKRMLVVDVLKLKRKYDVLKIPVDKRYLVLEPRHLEDLLVEDLKAFKDITDIVNGKPKRFAGFNILEYGENATYNASTKEKKAFGAVMAETDTYSSFAFSSDEVMKADGTVNVYSRENDPELRATIIGFDKRFIAMPIRNKANGAIISAKVA